MKRLLQYAFEIHRPGSYGNAVFDGVTGNKKSKLFSKRRPGSHGSDNLLDGAQAEAVYKRADYGWGQCICSSSTIWVRLTLHCRSMGLNSLVDPSRLGWKSQFREDQRLMGEIGGLGE